MHEASDQEKKTRPGSRALLLGAIVCIVIVLVVIRRWGPAARTRRTLCRRQVRVSS